MVDTREACCAILPLACIRQLRCRVERCSVDGLEASRCVSHMKHGGDFWACEVDLLVMLMMKGSITRNSSELLSTVDWLCLINRSKN